MQEPLEHGKLYVSKRFRTAIHLCACGCGEKTVTPLNYPGYEGGWDYSEDGTLYPSIGNDQFDCLSHYVVTEERIVWLPAFAHRRGKPHG